MSNLTWIENYNSKCLRSWNLTQEHIRKHLEQDTKLKVCNNWWNESASLFLYFDIDTHDGGKTEDVVKLFDALKSIFPNMPEPVITERGGSAWLLVNTRKEIRPGYFVRPSYEEWNNLVEQLDGWLNQQVEKMGLDLTEAAICGKVYAPSFDHRNRCVNVSAGQLFKCPPSEIWIDQPKTKYDELLHLHAIEEVKIPPQAEIERRQLAGEGTPSWKPHLLSQDVIDKLPEIGKAFALFANAPKVTPCGRYRIDAKRLAETILALTYVPCLADGTKAVERVGKFISCLYQQGIFEYGRSNEVIKAVRDWMSSEGMNGWVDHTYEFSSVEGQRGQACRWDVLPVVKEMIEKIVSGEVEGEKQTLSLLTLISSEFIGENLIPQRRGCSGQILPHWDCEAYRKSWDEYRLAA